jgi:short-subunit dehydrogenase
MISSGAGLIGIYGYSAYGAAKFALRGLAEILHAELRHEGVGVSIVFPPDTATPQFRHDARTRPAETSMIAGAAGVWDADAVAACIVKGIERGTYAITPGFELTALYWLGSLAGPLLQRGWARKIARMRDGASELATSKE